MALKYVRVVFAVHERDMREFWDQLEVFAEDPMNNPIQGSYHTEPYSTREAALNAPWVDRANVIDTVDPSWSEW